MTLADGTYWAYDYDALGQVKAGNHHLKDGMPLAGQHFEYDYDALGNRTFSRSGGDISWYSLRQVSYAPAGSAAQNVNTYATRAVPRYLEVQGVAQSGATVTVSGVSPYAVSPPVTRQGEYFRAELAITANTAVSETVSVTPTGGSTRMGTLFLAPATETYVHDADGNLKQDGHWVYTWDAENRLTSVTSLAGPTRIVNYRYDYAGRLVHRDDLNAGVTTTTKFLSDGWRCVAELSATRALQRTYLWGMDLSGGLSGAGGVGGLVAISSVANGRHFCAYDGNGNVTALVKASDGTVAARYEYGPFGEPLRLTGSAIAAENPFRFSTKRTDPATDFVHYEYRVYNPQMGRWLSRDPINEPGSQITRLIMAEGDLGEESNLYRYVGNEPVGRFDPWGLAYFAYRPLAGKLTEAMGVQGNKVDDRMNTMAAHEQLFFEDGKSPANLGYFSDSTLKSESDVSKFRTAHDTGWNDCIMRRAVANVKPSGYCLLGKPGKTEKYNCQDWVDAVRTEYRKLINDPKIIATCCPTATEKKK